MNKALLLVAFLVSALSTLPANAEDKALAKLFTDKGKTGVVVLSDLTGSQTYISNDNRANEAFLPASSFKVPNTLIALDAGVITDKEVIKWDGKKSSFPGWNQDQTLESAFKVSCVWYYQELARRIGTAGYERYFKSLDYGNGLFTPNVTTFWLDGDLRISAIDQVKFLKRVYQKEIPFKDSAYETLKRIMVVEKTPTYTLRGKTGWGQRVTPQVGWFVGYVEAGGKVWFFATNIEVRKPEDLRFRQQLTMEALKARGII